MALPFKKLSQAGALTGLYVAWRLWALGHGGAGGPTVNMIQQLVSGDLSLDELVKRYQTWHGLEVTGRFEDVVEHLDRPRCVHPDTLAASSSACRWPDTLVYYSQAIRLGQLDPARLDALYSQAWASWSAVCGLEARKNPPELHANVAARSGDGVGDNFDAAGTVLAWSQLPCGVSMNQHLEQVFNDREPWTEEMFLAVAAHEIGHAIGLPHLPGPNLLNPYYTPGITTPQPADIREAVARYGPPKTPPPAPAPAAGNPPEPPASVTPSSPAPVDGSGGESIVGNPHGIHVETTVDEPGPHVLTLSLIPPGSTTGRSVSIAANVPEPGEYVISIFFDQVGTVATNA